MRLKAEGRRQTVEFFPGFCFLPLAFDIMSAKFTIDNFCRGAHARSVNRGSRIASTRPDPNRGVYRRDMILFVLVCFLSVHRLQGLANPPLPIPDIAILNHL